jgi:hypothetical protein
MEEQFIALDADEVKEEPADTSWLMKIMSPEASTCIL